jgi:hypothetical protein
MTLRNEIEKLNELEKRLFGAAVIDVGLASVGYATDWKLLLCIGSASVLYDCYRGISLNNSRTELIRQENIQDRFGRGR